MLLLDLAHAGKVLVVSSVDCAMVSVLPDYVNTPGEDSSKFFSLPVTSFCLQCGHRQRAWVYRAPRYLAKYRQV